jgi:uncharacterized membrane protein (UPF0127 family)
MSGSVASRFEHLSRVEVLGVEVPVATGYRNRLGGLSGLTRADAGSGLLIPRCSSVHTFGMRFCLDLVFLDEEHRPLSARFLVPPRRFAFHPGAHAVLEVPSLMEGNSIWVLNLGDLDAAS